MENNNLTLGSLFDGSGGFPLGGLFCGVEPLWASEIEPFPIRVTTKRFPKMKHLGDVSTINGGEIPFVDIITFGSPCQDMSIAGKREGLSGSRSNLFYEAIRIVKEMRCKSNGKYPRYIVWENVPGAFSSNKGEDFKAVLEEICKIKDQGISVPKPKKWSKAGNIVGDGFSIAWRVLDAQYWGVPQRRKRIYLVADFAGECANEILFESKSLYGNFKESKDKTKGITTNVEESTRKTISDDNVNAHLFENHSQATRYKGPLEKSPTVVSSYGTGGNNQPFVVQTPKTLKIRCGCEGGGKGPLIQENKSATLGCNNDQTLFVPKVYGVCSKDSNAMKSKNPNSGFYEAHTSRCIDGNGGNPSCNQGGMAVVSLQGSMVGRKIENGPKGSGVNENISFTLNATDKHAVSYGIGRPVMNQGYNSSFSFQIEEELEPTLVASGASGVAHSVYSTSKNSHHTSAETNVANTLVATDYKDPPTVIEEPNYIVRRLTPTECARLQGFPDFWCENLETDNPTDEDISFWREVFETHRKLIGKSKKPKSDKQIIKWLKNPQSDSAEYKMWGNGVALPCVCFVLSKIVNMSQQENK